MVWTTLTDGQLSANKPLTQAVVRALRDNVAAAFAKDSGAPVLANGYVVEAMLGSAIVSQTKLKTTTGEISSSDSTFSVTLPGGEYGFWPQVRVTDSGSTLHEIGLRADITGITMPGEFFLTYSTGAPVSDTGYQSGILQASFDTNGLFPVGYVRQRYVQSSPPWMPYRDDDPVPIFVFALIDNATGNVLSTWTAEDPPWCNSGPTIVNPLGRMARALKRRLGADWASAKSNRASAIAYFESLERLAETPPDRELIEEINRPLSQAEKNADMQVVPHPFTAVDPGAQTVVVISPTDDRFCRALRFHYVDLGDSIGEILHRDYLIIDNDPIVGLATPSGVMAVRARWKLSP